MVEEWASEVEPEVAASAVEEEEVVLLAPHKETVNRIKQRTECTSAGTEVASTAQVIEQLKTTS